MRQCKRRSDFTSRHLQGPKHYAFGQAALFKYAQFNFTVSAVHIPGKQNAIADALSRFRFQEFFRLVPTASPSPTVIPQPLLDRLTSNFLNSEP